MYVVEVHPQLRWEWYQLELPNEPICMLSSFCPTNMPVSVSVLYGVTRRNKDFQVPYDGDSQISLPQLISLKHISLSVYHVVSIIRSGMQEIIWWNVEKRIGGVKWVKLSGLAYSWRVAHVLTVLWTKLRGYVQLWWVSPVAVECYWVWQTSWYSLVYKVQIHVASLIAVNVVPLSTLHIIVQ